MGNFVPKSVGNYWFTRISVFTCSVYGCERVVGEGRERSGIADGGFGNYRSVLRETVRSCGRYAFWVSGVFQSWLFLVDIRALRAAD